MLDAAFRGYGKARFAYIIEYADLSHAVLGPEFFGKRRGRGEKSDA